MNAKTNSLIIAYLLAGGRVRKCPTGPRPGGRYRWRPRPVPFFAEYRGAWPREV